MYDCFQVTGKYPVDKIELKIYRIGFSIADQQRFIKYAGMLSGPDVVQSLKLFKIARNFSGVAWKQGIDTSPLLSWNTTDRIGSVDRAEVICKKI